ncbi:MAG: hypothetical protein KDD39_01910 [Bdellovibrionales bacterium]|nr:hypothetical protein [Bdellovibrionales bacterium]
MGVIVGLIILFFGVSANAESFQDIFREPPKPAIELSISPFWPNDKAWPVDPMDDVFFGCRDIRHTLIRQEDRERLAYRLRQLPPWARKDCERKIALRIQELKAENPLEFLQANAMRDYFTMMLGHSFGDNFSEFPFLKKNSGKPNEPYTVYRDLPDGNQDYFTVYPSYPDLLFKQGQIYGNAGDRTALLMNFDEKTGDLEAGGFLAPKKQLDQLDLFLKSFSANELTPQQLKDRALIGASALARLGDTKDFRHLQSLVSDLVDIRERNLENNDGRNGLPVLDQVLDYMDRAGYPHRTEFLWKMARATESQADNKDMCENVCGLFSKKTRDKWKLGPSRLHALSEGSRDYAFASVQMRFALEALNYCPNQSEVSEVFNELLKSWGATWIDFKTNTAKKDVDGDPVSKSYGKSFSLFFDQRYKSLGKVVAGNPEANKLQFEESLIEDFSKPREFPTGDSRLHDTSFHFAYNLLAMPRKNEATNKAMALLDEFVETCSRVNGSPYALPYSLVKVAGKISEESCKHKSAFEEGSAARVPTIYLARYIHAKPEKKLEARKELEGAIEYFWTNFFPLKGSVTRNNGNSYHDQRRNVAPYYMYSGATAVAGALSILARDFPQDKARFETAASAGKRSLHGEWDETTGMFRTFGGDMAQFEQPLAGLAMFGLGACADPAKGKSFAMLAPNFGQDLEYYQTLDTSQLRPHLAPTEGQDNHRPEPEAEKPTEKKKRLSWPIFRLPKLPWQK